mgnify:CR=1 FL=1
MIDEWDGKEIIYPDDLVFTTMGEDTVKWFLKDSRYTIVNLSCPFGKTLFLTLILYRIIR